MPEAHGPQTRATLLARLYNAGTIDAEAWREFVDLYGRQVYKWCRYWDLQDADAREVTQQVLLQLVAKMKEFVYDPSRSFRAWLKTVTQRAWRNLAESPAYRPLAGGESGQWERLLTIPARDDLAQRLEQEFDRELLDKALLRVRLRVAPHNWEAFRLAALDGMPAADVASRLSMKIAHVYAARSNVQRLIREEMERLDRGQDGDGAGPRP
jgi:RNA polymerase sigma-70 factor (ECF subfamily)